MLKLLNILPKLKLMKNSANIMVLLHLCCFCYGYSCVPYT